jgi:hypothetical protein
MRKFIAVVALVILSLLAGNVQAQLQDRVERSGTQIRINFDGSISITLASGKTVNLVPQDSAPSVCKDGDFFFIAHDGLYQCVDGTALKLAPMLSYTAENAANKDIDGTLAGNSDVNYPSQKAVKTYADTRLATKQPLNTDLSSIASLSPSNDDIVQRKAGVWINRTMAQLKFDLSLAKGDVGLGNVDNTPDANKPVSTAQQSALDLKANLTAVVTSTAIYGDGSDGAITANGSSTLACLGAPSANVYTLTRGCFFTSLTVNSGVTIKTNNFALFVSGTLTNNGTIRNDGNSGSNSIGGTTTTAQLYGTGSAGGNGAGTNAAGSNGTAAANAVGGAGGAGGGNGTNSGGAAGTFGAPAVTLGSIRNYLQAISGRSTAASTLFSAGSGGGGGAGDGTGSGAGGGGGAGGGWMTISAKTITNSITGTISAKGGNGANGNPGSGSGNFGGGGGGGGGVMILVYNALTNAGTISVAGGTGGSGAGASAVAGSDGSTGTRIDFNNNN